MMRSWWTSLFLVWPKCWVCGSCCWQRYFSSSDCGLVKPSVMHWCRVVVGTVLSWNPLLCALAYRWRAADQLGLDFLTFTVSTNPCRLRWNKLPRIILSAHMLELHLWRLQILRWGPLMEGHNNHSNHIRIVTWNAVLIQVARSLGILDEVNKMKVVPGASPAPSLPTKNVRYMEVKSLLN